MPFVIQNLRQHDDYLGRDIRGHRRQNEVVLEAQSGCPRSRGHNWNQHHREPFYPHFYDFWKSETSSQGGFY